MKTTIIIKLYCKNNSYIEKTPTVVLFEFIRVDGLVIIKIYMDKNLRKDKINKLLSKSNRWVE